MCKLFRTACLLACSLFISAGFAEGYVVHEVDSIYHHITVTQGENQRCLVFGQSPGSFETCIRVNQLDYPVIEYTAIMFVGFLFHPGPKRVALAGLGGAYIPTVFAKHLKNVPLDVIEIDPTVATIARDYFGFRTGSTVSLTLVDGRQYFKRTDKRYDHIWLDAYNADYIPAHMTTLEFLKEVKAKLTPRGVVVSNVHSFNALFDSQVHTFQAAFKHVYVYRTDNGGNSIIVAADNPPNHPNGFTRLKNYRKLQIGKINLAEQAGKRLTDLKLASPVLLTDDYSPANLLNTRTK